jgi:Ca-activated chloride channel homolog
MFFKRTGSKKGIFITVLLFVTYFSPYISGSFISVAYPTSIKPQDTDDIIRIQTELVTIPAFVTDSKDRRIAGLTQNDFVIKDNGQAVKISHFSVGTDHVALIFLLDASGSVREIIKQQQETALSLFSRFGPGSRVAVLQFTEQPHLVVPFTKDTERAIKAFEFPVQRNHKTAIFNAASRAVREFKSNPSNIVERKIVILISDGLDTASSINAPSVINEARANNITFYVINFPHFVPDEGRLVPRSPTKGFRELAEKTGGQYFIERDVKMALDPHAKYDLTPIFKAIEEDLKGQYLLGFYRDEALRKAGPHNVKLTLSPTIKRSYKVHTLMNQ